LHACLATYRNLTTSIALFLAGGIRQPIAATYILLSTQDGTLEFKIPMRPIRKKITGLPAFTTLKGGAYFFLPGLKALRYLATLDGR
jgi:hypothetical protein